MDLTTLAIAAIALVVAGRFRKVPEPVLIGAAGVVGIVIKMLG